MKKLMYLALAFIAIATGFTACQQKSIFISGNDNEFKLEEVAPFFYKVVYDKDFDFNAGRKIINEKHMGNNMLFFSGGCSEVRYGDVVGRNLDWYVNNEAAAVLWMPGTDNVINDSAAILLGRNKRFKSVGMVGANPQFKYPCKVSQEVGDTLSKTLALSMTDGINERGVYIGVNVAPAGETSLNPKNWHPGVWGNGAAYTKKEELKEQKRDTTENAMCVTYLTRIVLNYAENVEDAIEIIDNLNWFEPYEYKYNKDKTEPVKVCQAFHWLICDSYKSAVVEFIDNKLEYRMTKGKYELGLGSVMTNFSNYIYVPTDSTMVQHGGSGYERYNYIVNYFKKNPKNCSIQDIMQDIHFSNFYHKYYKDCDLFKFLDYKFPTEFACKDLPADSLYPSMKWGIRNKFAKILHNLCEDWPQGSSPDSIRKSGNDSTYWYSTHTSIYNLKNQSFKVLIHEGYDEKEKNPDGSKKMIYREFALGKSGIVDPYKGKTNSK